MYEYKFRSVQQGQLADVCNECAADDFQVDSFIKDGDKFYVLFLRFNCDDEEVEATAEEALYYAIEQLAGRLEVLESVLTLKALEEKPAEE